LGNWEVIDSVAFDILSRTDPNPPQTSNLGYMIEAVPSTGCTATLMKKGKNYNTSKSNKANRQATGIQTSEVFKTSEVLNAYPNPFTGKTQITYSNYKKGYVLLDVFNVLGEKVFSLVNETQNKGKYQYTINTKEEDNDQGIFIVKLIIDNKVYTKLLVAIK